MSLWLKEAVLSQGKMGQVTSGRLKNMANLPVMRGATGEPTEDTDLPLLSQIAPGQEPMAST